MSQCLNPSLHYVSIFPCLSESLLTPPPIENHERQTPPRLPDTVRERSTVPERRTDAFTTIKDDGGDIGMSTERQLRQVSGFLCSLIIHLIILITLALVLIPTHRSDPLVISIAADHNQDPWAKTEALASITNVDIVAPPDEAMTADPVMSELVTVDLVDLAKLESTPLLLSSSANGDTASKAPSAPPSDSGDTSKDKSIKFFGAEAYGNRFVFVLDVSSSMAARNGQRLERATKELIGSINQLNNEQSFLVILYSNHALPMFLKNNEAVMRQATPSNKQAAIKWLKYQVRPQGGTMPARALQIAGNLKPDAVFFLSDGEFLYGHAAHLDSPLNSFFQSFGAARKAMPPPGGVMLDPQAVLAEYPQETIVHTIAFESINSGPLMERIAKQKGGQYRFIPAP